jgi:signal transduction histidine kinase
MDLAADVHVAGENVPFIPLFYDLEEIFSQVAHESRNYMSPLMGYASLLADHTQPMNEGHHLAKRMLGALAAMGRYFDQLDTYRIQGISRTKEVEWGTFIENVVQTFLDSSRDRVQVNIQNGVRGNVLIHSVLIRRALLHVLRNAAESMRSTGAVELNIALEERAQSGPGRDAIVITVKDEGCGVSQAKMDHMWRAFFSTKPNHFGLGLPYVSMAASILGMTIDVQSEEGKGTTFSMTFKPKGGHVETSQASRR